MAETSAIVTLQARDQASRALASVGDAAGDAQQDVARLQGELDGVSSQSDRAGRSAGDLGDRFGAAGGAASKLAGALGGVSPELAGVAGGMADLADVGELLSGGMGALGVSMGGLLAILGPVAIAAAGLALVYRDLSAALTEVQAANEAASTVASEALSIRDAVAQARLELAAAYDEEAAAAAKAQAVEARWVAIAEQGTAALREQRTALEERLAAAERLSPVARELERIDAGAELARVDAQIGAAQAGADRGRDLELGRLEYEQEVRRQQQRERDAAAAASRQAQADAQRLAALATIERAGLSVADARARVAATYQAQIDSVTAAAAAAGVDAERVAGVVGALNAKMAAEIADLDRSALWDRIEGAGADLEPLRDVLSEARAEAEVLAGILGGIGSQPAAATEADLALALSRGQITSAEYDQALAQSASAQSASGAASVADALSTAAAGPQGLVTAVAGAAGPYGAIVSAGVELVQRIGDGMLGELGTFLVDLGADLEGLGPALADFLPTLLGEVVPSLLGSVGQVVRGILVEAVPAILQTLLDPAFWLDMAVSIADAYVQSVLGVIEFGVRGIGEIVAPLSQAVQDLFSPDWWRGVGDAIAEAIRDLFALFGRDGAVAGAAQDAGQWVQGAGETLAGWFRGGFDSGSSYIAEDGMALVHRGEEIVRRDGTSRVRAAGMRDAAAAGVTVNVNGALLGTVEDLVRLVVQELGPQGRGLSLEPR